VTAPPRTSVAASLDVSLGGGYTLRVTRLEDSLVLAPGYGGAGTDTPFNRPAWGGPPLSVPIEALSRLRHALEALEAVEEVEG
jgi:hypothetical protein